MKIWCVDFLGQVHACTNLPNQIVLQPLIVDKSHFALHHVAQNIHKFSGKSVFDL